MENASNNKKKALFFFYIFSFGRKSKKRFFILEVKTSQKRNDTKYARRLKASADAVEKTEKKCSTQIYFYFTWIKKGRKLIFLKLIKINSKYDKNFQADVQAKLHKKTCQTPSAFREKQTSWCNGVKYYTRIKRKMLKSEKESWREKFLTSLLLRIIQIFLI